MAIVRVRPGEKRPPSTGPIYYASRRGYIYASAKPHKWGRKTYALQKERLAWFTEAAKAVRYMDAAQIVFAKNLTRGYAIMWRDFLMQGLAGRFGVLVMEDGSELHSLAERDDVSDALDLIGLGQGVILVRGELLWEVITPSVAGTILTSQGTETPPSFQVPPVGLAPSNTCQNAPGPVSNAGNASLGVLFQALIPLRLRTFWCYFHWVAGASYKITVWKISGVTLLNKIGTSNIFGTPIEGVANAWLPLTADAVVSTFDEIAIFLTRTDDLPSTPCKILKANARPTVPPCLKPPWLIRMSSVDPLVGQTFIKDTTGTAYNINFAYWY